MPSPNRSLGLVCAIVVVCMWSGFIVFSRLGVVGALTAYDVAALRFIVAGALTLPFALAWWPRHLGLGAQVVLMICGPGAVYSTMMFLGLSDASAAYGGVFANGTLPIFTMMIVFAVTGARPGAMQFLAVAVIMLGGVMVGYRGMANAGADVVQGIVLFMGASALIAVYIFAVGRWQVTPRQALALINVPNAVVFLPLWFFALPSGIDEAEVSVILFQALFQGIGPGFLAMILFALSAAHLGATPTAAFAASVPASAALLAIPVLGEQPGMLEWLGIGTVTIGLALLILVRSDRPKPVQADL